MIKRIGEKDILKTKFFTLKDITLQSSDDKVVTYQVIEKRDTALIVPVASDHRVYFVREYFAAIDEYGLSLPKGRIEEGYDEIQTANKELQEEIGFKAKKLDRLAVLTMSPGYLTQKTHVFLAQDLVGSKLSGDELEEIEVVDYPFFDFGKLIEAGEIKEARVIAALYLAKRKLKNK